MKLGYIFSVAIIPFMLLGTSTFDQENKDKNQKGDKGGKSNSEKFEKQDDRDGQRGKDNDNKGNQADRKYKNDDRYDNVKGNKQKGNDDRYDNVKGNKQNGKKGRWKEDDRWDDGRWDDNRFDARMKKLKGFKRSNWVNAVYYPGVVWFTGNNDYYTSKGPKGNKKVTICHKPNGNDYPVTISVSENAVNAHLKKGDYVGECRDYDRSRFSDNYWITRDNYYNQYSQTTETLSFGEQILVTAIDVLTNRRSQLASSRLTLQEDELRRKEAAIINLQNDVYNLQNSLDRSNEQVGLQVNLRF
jgi:hypothetical protein